MNTDGDKMQPKGIEQVIWTKVEHIIKFMLTNVSKVIQSILRRSMEDLFPTDEQGKAVKQPVN